MKKILLASFSLFFSFSALGAVGPEIIQRQQQQDLENQIRMQELENIAAQSPYATGAVQPREVSTDIFGTENRWVRAFTPGLFIDFGMTFPNATGRDHGTMAGGGVKLGFKYWLIDASATYARVIASEDWMTEDYSMYLYLGLSGRF
ncbi:hypothetical protein LJC18_03905 [Lachnospiraceae bacterium OttesenSCG-928-E19]|nr:hypothetical protein [Lachnospiraceae bacterium OttesenSCG-928-E19]